MSAAKHMLTGLMGAMVTVAAFTTGVDGASAYPWYHQDQRDWRKEVICTYDYTHNDAFHYEQDGCPAIYGSFSEFGRNLRQQGYWTEDRDWNYTQNDTPVYHPTQYVPYTRSSSYNDRPYYFSNTASRRTYEKYARSPYSWRCVEQIARDHQLKPCI